MRYRGILVGEAFGAMNELNDGFKELGVVQEGANVNGT
jgi:hypothetical protein